MTTKITEQLFESFVPSKTFRYHRNQTPITSLDFDDSGQFLVSSGVDESIQVYDCLKGKHHKSVFSKKYGTHLARFTHHQKNCLYASTKEEHTIRYLSLHDNTYIRYFKGHKGLVNSLEINPCDDTFLSASYDASVRLWDLRSSNCQGYMTCKNPSIVSYDPSGLVFAVGNTVTKEIGLYDSRNYDQEPFITFDLKKYEKNPTVLERMVWNKLEFSNDGKHLLVGTNYQYHYVLDSFEGELITKLTGHFPMKPRQFPDTGSVCFSPDSRFIFGGSGPISNQVNSVNKLCMWDLHDLKDESKPKDFLLKPVKLLDYDQGVPAMVQFNPKLMMLATADTELTMWLPEPV